MQHAGNTYSNAQSLPRRLFTRTSPNNHAPFPFPPQWTTRLIKEGRKGQNRNSPSLIYTDLFFTKSQLTAPRETPGIPLHHHDTHFKTPLLPPTLLHPLLYKETPITSPSLYWGTPTIDPPTHWGTPPMTPPFHDRCPITLSPLPTHLTTRLLDSSLYLLFGLTNQPQSER